MTGPNPRVVLSADRRQMTVLTATAAGTHRAVLQRAASQEPFNDEDVRLAQERVRPTLKLPGQKNITRRWVTPFGNVYAHLMLGPPTWWLPKVRIRRGLMVGWLRAAIAIKVSRMHQEYGRRRR